MVLAGLGRSDEEEGLYRALVEFPSAAPAALSSTTGMPPTAPHVAWWRWSPVSS